MTDEIAISGSSMGGMAIRLNMLMTHYRKPLDWRVDRLAQADKTYRKWLRVVSKAKHQGIVPDELLKALFDDLNTSEAIALMHGYAKRGEAEKLFASMELLGLLPAEVQRARRQVG